MSKPKAQKAPPVPAPTATPETAPETEDTAVKRARRKRGYASTILTGGLVPTTGGKKVLG